MLQISLEMLDKQKVCTYLFY